MGNRVRPEALRSLFAGLFCGLLFLFSVIDAPVASASMKAVLESLAKATQKAGDDATKHTASVLDALGKQSDESLAAAGKSLNAKPSSLDEAVDALRRAGVQDSDSFRSALSEMDNVQRGVIKELVATSRQVVERADSLGRGVDDVIAVAGHQEGIAVLRMMQRDEAFAAVLEGQKRFGSEFVEFAKRVDEPGVVGASRRFDELEELRKTAPDKFDDIMKNPTKYFDEAGKPTKALDELLASVRKSGVPKGAAGMGLFAAGAALVNGIITTIASGVILLRNWLTAALPFLARSAWAIYSILALVALVLLLAVAWGAKLLWLLVRLLWSLVPGRFGAFARQAREKQKKQKQEANRAVRFRPRTPPRKNLHIGLLGVQRVGKTTFIGMLSQHLQRLVTGALLRPHDEKSEKNLKKILKEIVTCQPTHEDSDVVLDLTWPFNWKSSTSEASQSEELEAEETPRDYSNKMELQLHLKDYPGEWASDDETVRSDKERKKLIQELRPTDALVVVIDPSDLEAPDNRDRRLAQQRAVEAMFRADGLGLGDAFRRTLCILITKRDTLDRARLEQLARSSGEPLGDEFERMVKLAEKQVLSTEESRELGEWVFQKMFPSQWETIQSRLAVIGGNRYSCVPFWGGFFRWFSVPTEPQVAVFAVSQLGTSLGKQVSRYREQAKAWEESGQEGPKPTTELPLEEMGSDEVEVHHPFTWIFDSVPRGWLHELAGYPYLSRIWCLLSLKRRFAGSPDFRQAAVRVWGFFVLLFVVSAILIAGGGFGLSHWSEHAVARSTIHLADDYIQHNQLAEFQAKLEAWKSFSTNPYPEVRPCLAKLLEVAQQRPEGQIEINDARGWLRSLADTSIPSSEFRQDLDNARNAIRSQADRVIEVLTRESIRKADEIAPRDYRPAVEILDDAISVLSKLPSSPPSQQKDLEQKRRAILDDVARRMLEQANNRAQPLAGEHKYAEAIAALDEIRWPDLLLDVERQEWESKRQDERKRILDNAWDYVGTEATRTAKEGELPQAFSLIDDFIAIPDNEHRRAAEDLRGNLRPMAYEAALHKAQQEIDAGNLDNAKDILETLRGEEDVENALIVRWYVLMGTVLTRQEKYPPLVTHWKTARDLNEARHSEIVPDAVWQPQLADAWSRLLEQYKREVDEAITDHGPGAHKEALATLKDLEQKLRDTDRDQTLSTDQLAEIPEILRKVYSGQIEVVLGWIAEDFSAARGELSYTIVPALKKLSSRPEFSSLVEKTLKRVIAACEVNSEYETGARIVDTLRQEQLFTLNDEWEKIVYDLWQKAAQHRVEDWRRRLDSAENAWQSQEVLGELKKELLRRDTPQSYQDELVRLTEELVRKILEDRKNEIEDLLIGKEVSKANDMLNNLEEILRPLAGAFAFLDKDLSILRTQVKEAMFEQDLDELKRTGLDAETIEERSAWMQRWNAKKGRVPKDQHRSELERCRQDVVEQWEKKDGRALADRWHASEYQRARELAEKYLQMGRWDVNLTRESDARRALAWIAQFDKPQQYTLTGIAYKGVPYSWINFVNSRFDLACRVLVYDDTGKVQSSVGMEAESVYGDGVLRKFKGEQTITWAPGQAVTLDVWDDEIGKKGRYIGNIEGKEEYSLIQLATEDAPINAAGGNFPSYNWTSCKFRLMLQRGGTEIKKPSGLFNTNQ